MSETTMPKAYNHLEFEEPLYEWWNQNGFFRPEQQLASGLADANAESFVISMPPPNVTGKLHLGHAITSSIEDMLIRYNRMKGRPTLWMPGTDHAGIATQNVVEKQLARQGIRRQDLGREKFVAEVWDWKAEYHGAITALPIYTKKGSSIKACAWSIGAPAARVQSAILKWNTKRRMASSIPSATH